MGVGMDPDPCPLMDNSEIAASDTSSLADGAQVDARTHQAEHEVEELFGETEKEVRALRASLNIQVPLFSEPVEQCGCKLLCATQFSVCSRRICIDAKVQHDKLRQPGLSCP